MNKLLIAFIIGTLFATAGCSMLISTPRVTHIQIHGMDDQLNEYIVVFDPEPSEHMIDIKITDRYALNLDFDWLINATTGFEATDVDGQSPDDISVTPWIMCTYKF